MPQRFHCHAVETKFPRRAFLAGLAAVAPFAAPPASYPFQLSTAHRAAPARAVSDGSISIVPRMLARVSEA